MGIIQENIRAVEALIDSVKKHCMCLKFEETKHHFIVIYPDGYYPNGCRITKEIGKIKALEKLHLKIEQHWQESFI